MKRCKAVTSRACDSIECTLLDEHEGAHEGQRDKDTRAVWTNPEAPTYLPLDGGNVPGSAIAHEAARAGAWGESHLRERAVADVFEERRGMRKTTHCACGAAHDRKLDPTLRTEFAMPLQAFNYDAQQPDQRFAWPLVCRECGAVYCPIHQTL